MLNLEVTTCFYWITMCIHLWSGAILIHDLFFWVFPKCEIPKPLLSHEQFNNWANLDDFLSPQKFRETSWILIIIYHLFRQTPKHLTVHELLLAQPASPLRATVSWTPDKKKAVEPSSPSLPPWSLGTIEVVFKSSWRKVWFFKTAKLRSLNNDLCFFGYPQKHTKLDC